MARKPKRHNYPTSHPMLEAGWIHELDVLDILGVSWTTWEREYRTRINGRTTPIGRWFLKADLIAWWNESGSSVNDKSPVN